MSTKRNRVCPVGLSGSLDVRMRRVLQNPEKILRPYVREGMTVLDIGCGPGYFSVPMARMVGARGKVIASDLQEGMLEKLGGKIRGTELDGRITRHKNEQARIGIGEKVDFALAFYMLHEVPDQEPFLRELRSIVKTGGRMLLVEPKLFHVSRKAFAKTVGLAERAGFQVVERPKLLLSWAALFK